jgi:Amidase
MTSSAAITDVCELTAHRLLAAYRARALSPVEVVEALLAHIDALDPALGAFTTLCAGRARLEASAHERAYMSGRPAGPLAGVPIGVKDLFDTEHVRTAYGSPMFSTNTPEADAAAVRSVREAGAILVGKTWTTHIRRMRRPCGSSTIWPAGFRGWPWRWWCPPQRRAGGDRRVAAGPRPERGGQRVAASPAEHPGGCRARVRAARLGAGRGLLGRVPRRHRWQPALRLRAAA